MPGRPLCRRAAAVTALPLLIAAALATASAGDGLGPGAARAAAPAAGPPPSTGCRYRPRATNVRRGPATGRRIALTFDDGPSPFTARVLDVLEREHVPATFFLVGEHVAGHEALLRRMLADGDMIGNHTFTHVDLAAATAAELRQVDRTQATIAHATGFTPCLLRPPYGLSTKRLLAALGRRRLTSVLWSVDPQDFTRPGTATIVRRVLAGARAGSIILDHDGGGDRSQTLAAIPAIVDALRGRGYRFVTVTDLLGLGSPAADPAGRRPR